MQYLHCHSACDSRLERKWAPFTIGHQSFYLVYISLSRATCVSDKGKTITFTLTQHAGDTPHGKRNKWASKTATTLVGHQTKQYHVAVINKLISDAFSDVSKATTNVWALSSKATHHPNAEHHFMQRFGRGKKEMKSDSHVCTVWQVQKDIGLNKMITKQLAWNAYDK